jgi:hypothetical protein
VIEPRVYRAAFIPALVATVLAMFSLENRPRPLPQGLAADVLFDGNLAAESARTIAERAPDRRPGTPGDLATARRVADTLSARGFSVERTRFSEDDRQLVNVVGRRAGKSRRQVVVVAPRDSAVVPEVMGSAADTAALLELARVFEGRPSEKTLVLASVDGSTLGEAGASRLADQLGDPGLVDGVLVMSDLAAKRRKGGAVVAWSNDSKRAGIGLQRTAVASLREELEEGAGSTGASGQLTRLAMPVGIGSQGVFLERGYDSIRISGSGELPPEGSGPASQLDRDRLGGLGRTTLRTVTALDQGPTPGHGPDSYVIAVSQVLPGWVLAVLALAFLIPVLVASVDAFARARRRRMAVAPWLRWLAAGVLPFVIGLALAELLSVLDATPAHAGAPVAPDVNPLDGAALGVLGGLTLTVAGVYFLLRRAVVATDSELRDPASPGAACAVALVVSATVLVLWFVNPYAALVLVPAAHLWMLATLVRPPPPARVRLVMIAGGLLPPLLVAVHYLVALSMDPVSGAWYLLLLVTGHSVGLITALAGCVMLGALASVVSISRATRDERAPAIRAGDPDQPVYGPGAYAGPGSLGGTESALRR